MTEPNLKQPILSISACSIPVMLAVIGWSASAHATDIHSTQSYRDGVMARYSAQAENPVYQGKTAQSDANWMCMSPDKQHFWVSKGHEAAIATYRFTDSVGKYELLSEVDDLNSMAVASWDAATGAAASGWIDLVLSDDGQHLHQVFGESGMIAIYEVDGGDLTLIEVLSA